MNVAAHVPYHVEDRKIICRQAEAVSLLPPSGVLSTELRSSELLTGAWTGPSLYLNKAISCQISLASGLTNRPPTL